MLKKLTFFLLCMMLTLGAVNSLLAEGETIIFCVRPDWFDVTTGELADQPFIDDLEDLGYDVITYYNDDFANATQADIDMLNDAHLIILGRSMPSVTSQAPHKEVWNSLTAPMLQLSMWSCRSNRMNWFNSETCTHFNENIEFYALIEDPTDPVFEGVEMDGDECLWALGSMDIISINDPGNGIVLARSYDDQSVQFVRFEPDEEFYPGSVDMPAGHRTFIGNGNDAVTDADGNNIINFWNWSEQSLKVYRNEIARMVKLSGGSSVSSNKSEIDGFRLSQNYPNPFNPTTNIEFSLEKAGHTTIQIYNALGQLVETLIDKNMQSGVHNVTFNAENLESGVYFYKIISGEFTDVKKMIFMK